MSGIPYYNRSAPFWDFIANLEDQGFTARGGESNNHEANERPNPWTDHWAQAWGGFPFGGPFPHRGRHGPPGPPPPPEHSETPPVAPEQEKDGEAGPSELRGPPQPSSDSTSHHTGPGAHRGRCGGRGRGWGGRGRGGPHGRHGGFPPMMGGFGALAQMFQDQLFDGGEGSKEKASSSEDFKPEVDIFDTPESFVVHVSLPGANKEDVGVSWDAEKSELSIAGVVYRPGDEEFLKTLALDERKVGAFERKVRLGSRANPAQVDVEGIGARLEDGVLRVEVPKLDAGYVEIKKVDIE